MIYEEYAGELDKLIELSIGFLELRSKLSEWGKINYGWWSRRETTKGVERSLPEIEEENENVTEMQNGVIRRFRETNWTWILII